MQQVCHKLCNNYDISQYDLKVDLTIKMTEACQQDPELTCWDRSPLWGQECANYSAVRLQKMSIFSRKQNQWIFNINVFFNQINPDQAFNYLGDN